MTTRPDGRAPGALRPPSFEPGFHRLAEGSCLYRAGGTVVLCTVSCDASVPPFLEGTGRGWVTAEYQMHPRASPKRREARDGRGRPVGGRTQEIQRLVGRALRSAVDLEALGPRTLALDCDVLEADGGTRTASITGGFVALCLALARLASRGELARPVVRDQVAAVSVGHVDGEALVDLAYVEDSRARVDLNLVATAGGDLIEVQGTAEGAPLPRADFDAMVTLGLDAVAALCREQRRALEASGVELSALTRAAGSP
ncbi:MAG TPA: ribonuclease PH [Polyangiaceae bacterium]|nr:ribonuclease PH [Polyangiaceae bacterium]